MASPESVRDQIGTPYLQPCRDMAIKQINHVQGESPATQLVGTALAVVAMSEAIGTDPHDVLLIAQRMVRAAEGPFTHQIQALRDYAKSELRRV